jgi:hypothetical protein
MTRADIVAPIDPAQPAPARRGQILPFIYLPNSATPLDVTRMEWHVQYRKDAVDYIARRASPEEAIETACRLIDDGYDVYGIGTGPLTDSIARDQIARIYDLWARVKTPSLVRISN